MALFVRKFDIQCHLLANGITAHHPDFTKEVEDFLLEKFNLQSHELDDKSLETLKEDVLEYRRKIRRFCKRHKYNDIMSKHEVREFDFFMALVIFSNNYLSSEFFLLWLSNTYFFKIFFLLLLKIDHIL